MCIQLSVTESRKEKQPKCDILIVIHSFRIITTKNMCKRILFSNFLNLFSLIGFLVFMGGKIVDTQQKSFIIFSFLFLSSLTILFF